MKKITKFKKKSPTHTDKHLKTKHSGKPISAPLLVWGRHVVESFLSKISEQKKVTSHFQKTKSSYILHIIVDKSGKVPGQLAHIHDTAKMLALKIMFHRSEQSWPLADTHETLVHQRICLQIPEYPTEDISVAYDIIQKQNMDKDFSCAGIILDHIQDPRNFGAILRSAAFFGVKFVIYAQNRQATISPLVLKASAGGAFALSLIPVVNLNRAIKDMQEAGAWILGTANSENALEINKLPKDRVWISVLGNEGSGMSSEVQKNCDFVTKIPGGTPLLDSLNVSVAAGVLLHSLKSDTSCLD